MREPVVLNHGLGISRLFEILRARKLLVVGVWAVVAAGAILLALVLPPVYTAEVSLVVDSRGVEPVSGAMVPTQLAQDRLGTEIQVIASHSVALKVVDRFKIDSLPDVIMNFRSTASGSQSIRDWAADQLLRKLTVTPSREGNVVRIAFSSQDPAFSAELANAFADAYMKTSIELRGDPARRQAGWFGEQVGELRKRLEEAQQRLSDFQQQSEIPGGPGGGLEIENARLAELSSQVVLAQASGADARTRLDRLVRGSEQQRNSHPDVLNNPLLQSLKSDLVRARSQLAEAASRYGANHPAYRSAVAQVDELQDKFNAELGTVTAAIRESAAVAAGRSGALQRELEEQKARILKMGKLSDQLDVLRSEVASAQRTYDAAVLRAGEVRLEGQLDQGTIAVLSPATPPAFPASPSLPLNAILGLLFGAGLGGAVALIAELLDRRVRAVEDVQDALDVIVLAEIPRLLRPVRGAA